MASVLLDIQVKYANRIKLDNRINQNYSKSSNGLVTAKYHIALPLLSGASEKQLLEIPQLSSLWQSSIRITCILKHL